MNIIRVIDLEATGLESSDQVVEIGAVDLCVDDARVELVGSDLVKPTVPIPPETSGIHHIVDADVAEAAEWDAIWPVYVDHDEITAFAAHNAGFEAQHVSQDMRKGKPLICTWKSALRVWPEAPNHKNQTLRYWLASQPDSGFPADLDRDLANQTHRALPDAYVTAHIMACLLRKASIEEMVKWTAEPPLLPTCPIGTPWRGMPWAKVDESFLHWMLGKRDTMNPDHIWNVEHELKRRDEEEHREEQASERRRAYLVIARQAIVLAQSVDDLRNWFVSETENRNENGITIGSDTYNDIVAACTARKVELEQINLFAEQMT